MVRLPCVHAYLSGLLRLCDAAEKDLLNYFAYLKIHLDKAENEGLEARFSTMQTGSCILPIHDTISSSHLIQIYYEEKLVCATVLPPIMSQGFVAAEAPMNYYDIGPSQRWKSYRLCTLTLFGLVPGSGLRGLPA